MRSSASVSGSIAACQAEQSKSRGGKFGSFEKCSQPRNRKLLNSTQQHFDTRGITTCLPELPCERRVELRACPVAWTAQSAKRRTWLPKLWTTRVSRRERSSERETETATHLSGCFGGCRGRLGLFAAAMIDWAAAAAFAFVELESSSASSFDSAVAEDEDEEGGAGEPFL